MERHEVEALLTLAEELHFGRTAQRLHVTTGRVSQTIRQLEHRVGVPLFERTSRKVALTPIGKQLVDDIRPAYAQLRAGLARAIEAGKGLDGELRVGFVGAAAAEMLINAEEVFGKRYPGCAVHLKEMHLGDAPERLRSGEIDIMLGCFPLAATDLVTGPTLLTEQWLLAAPARHPLARRSHVATKDLAGQTFLQAPCGLSFAGTHPGPRAETFQEILTLVSAGKGIFAVGEHAIRFHDRPDIAYVPISDAPKLEWGPVWRATNENARVRGFVEALTGA
ncbi:LysR family transcriptional regulator [Kibdelosporangium aridum]|uniref:LysR family transcriptional regulator n=1 Tax=Kibdelosporangium aridum TaxID=2030 RepID=A0A428ZDF6_KIBAR|nr:LysR family transcriptional regulator [Kibdelosporangium aridum]RSM86081.1 LysR family transcriptional regulator [Kibdelosporangium aridum]